MSVREDLIKAKALIDTPEKWRKGIKPDAPFCAGEALSEMMAIHQSDEMVSRKGGLIIALGFQDLDDLVAYNDNPETTHTDMMALFNRAIEASK